MDGDHQNSTQKKWKNKRDGFKKLGNKIEKVEKKVEKKGGRKIGLKGREKGREKDRGKSTYLISLHNELYSVILVLSSKRERTAFASAFMIPWHITQANWELGPNPKNFR